MLLQVLLLLYNIVLHANGFSMKSGFLHGKRKFNCEALKIYIASVKNVCICIFGAMEENANNCNDFKHKVTELDLFNGSRAELFLNAGSMHIRANYCKRLR